MMTQWTCSHLSNHGVHSLPGRRGAERSEEPPHLYASEKGKLDPYKPVIPNTSEQFKRFLQPVL